MKKKDLLALIEALPDCAEIEIANDERGGSDDIAGVVPAADSYTYMFDSRGYTPPGNLYVFRVGR